MRLEKVLLAHAARIIGLATANLYMRNAVRMLQERYEFVQVPTTADQLLPEEGQPLVFEHGQLVHEGRPIVIHKLQIYRQAMVVETGLTTDDSDLVLGDLIRAGRERGLITRVGTPLLYISQLEIGLDSTLEQACPISRAIGARLLEVLTRYAYGPPSFPMPQVFGIAMKPDPQKQQMPCDFRIEKREGASYDDTLHFSQAPLRTSDHVAVLEEFDRLNAGTSR